MRKHPGILTIPRPGNTPSDTVPPVVRQLQAVFQSLDDKPLITALVGPTRRGPKGHPVRVLWYCLAAKYVLGLASTAALIRTLQNNPYIAEVCGISNPNDIPHESTFSRFIARLSKKRMLAKVKDVSRAMVRQCYEELPGFGERVALDSSTLKGWANGGKTKKSDPEAGWSVKKGTQGQTEYTYGWKLHLLVDCEYELPIAAVVSPGNVHDVKKAPTVLREARTTYSEFGPRYLIADKGYSSAAFDFTIRRQYRATPIIDAPSSHKKRLAKRDKTEEWAALYRLRGAVERAFSRLKGQRSLDNITVRRKRKVTLHCYLSLIAMKSLALWKNQGGLEG